MAEEKKDKAYYQSMVEMLFWNFFEAPEREAVLEAADYSNDKWTILVKWFRESVEHMGLSFSNVYHAYGIGNNNEYTIMLKETDADGFEIEKKVCTFFYCKGIYGGVYTQLKDNNGSVIARAGHAR